MREPIQLKPHQTLREVLAVEPRASRILEVWNVDYYCGGDQTLAEACSQSGYALEELQSSVNRLRDSSVKSNEELVWYTAPLKELTGHIVSKHHAYLRKKLPELLDLARKVSDIHAEDHPETAEVLKAMNSLWEALEPHLSKEEEKLFPLLQTVEDVAEGKQPSLAAQPLEKTLPLVFAAHHTNNSLLRDLRRLTKDFSPPEDACYSFQRLWKGLQQLEKDMHRHLHLENNILLPRAQDYEKRMVALHFKQ